MLYLRAKDSGQSPAEMWLGRQKVEQQPYLAYSLNRLITDWGRFVSNKLAEYDDKGKPLHKIEDLLKINPQPPTQRQIAASPIANGYASKRKKPNPLTDEQVAAAWRDQISEYQSSDITIVKA